MFDIKGPMLKTVLGAIKPHLNSIGVTLFDLKDERAIADPADVRIVILARKDAQGKVHTFMQYVQTQATTEDPNQRVMQLLLDEQGAPMHFGIDGLVTMLSGKKDA